MKLYYLFLLVPSLFFAQNNLKVVVTDPENVAIVRAIVIITQNENQIAFGTTSEKGIFEKTLPNGTYAVRISKLGFVAKTIVIALPKDEYLAVQLQIETNKLETVIIKSRPKIMKVKQDTIQYNLKNVVDGTERKVEDIIKKLPGMQVDADGKVSYKGQQIDKVLIDGNEFFGNKHQMATQNINANMVDGIDLLTNFQGFSTAGNGGTIALNLKLKEGFRGKFVGDIEASGGNNNARRFHSNLFRFKKTGNLAIISDFNTIAKIPITVDDYREMRTPTDEDLQPSGGQIFELPKFLEPSDYVKQKHNGFVGVTYTNLLTKKSKITFSNLFNNTDIVQQSAIRQTNIGNNNVIVSFANMKSSNALLSNTNFKWEFNKSKKTFLSYDCIFTPNTDLEQDNITKPTNNISSNIQNNNFSFNQTFKVTTKLFDKIIYRFQMSHGIENNNRSLTLDGNFPFFGTNFQTLKQNFFIKKNNLSVQNKFSIKLQSNTFVCKFVLDHQNSNSESRQNTMVSFDGTQHLSKNQFQTELSWQRFWSSKFNTTIAARSTTNMLFFDNQQNIIPRLEPSLLAQYSFSQVNKMTFSFAVNHEFPSILQLQTNSIVNDFQVINRPSAVAFDQLIQKKEFGLDYLWFGISTQSILFSKISYSIQDNAIANNGLYNLNFSENNLVLTPRSNQFRLLSVYDLKINGVPFSTKTTAVYMKIRGFTAFNNVLSEMSTETFSVKQQLFSNFKNAIFQFDINYNINKRNSFQSINNFQNSAFNYQITGTLKAKFAQKFKGDISFTRDFQNSGFTTNKIYFLNTNLDFQLNKKCKIVANGFNLLNLKTATMIRTSIDNNFFSESINSILPGYLMAGVNYSF